MFDERALKELASVETEGPILSVYLNVDSTQRNSEEYKLELRELLKCKAGGIDSEDVEAVKRYLEYDYDGSGRGLVIFSRQAEGIWYAYSLAVPVCSGVTVARRPYISPLVERNGLYGRYAVALVDRQGGKFHFFDMGELIDQRGFVGEDVHHTRKGRGSSVHGMRGGSQLSGRREAELVNRNLKETAVALTGFCQEHLPRRLLLGGAEPTIAKFREVLPAPVNDLVVGSLGVDFEAGEVEVREQSLALLRELEQERHEKVVEVVMTSAAKGLNGVVGLDQTLSVANEGRVQVLLVERDYHQSGYQCTGCGYLTTQRLNRCIFCDGDFTEIPDAVEAAVTQVVEKGGTVEVVDEERMEDARIGALLRY